MLKPHDVQEKWKESLDPELLRDIEQHLDDELVRNWDQSSPVYIVIEVPTQFPYPVLTHVLEKYKGWWEIAIKGDELQFKASGGMGRDAQSITTQSSGRVGEGER